MKQGSKQPELIDDKNTDQIYKEEQSKIELGILKKWTDKKDEIA